MWQIEKYKKLGKKMVVLAAVFILMYLFVFMIFRFGRSERHIVRGEVVYQVIFLPDENWIRNSFERLHGNRIVYVDVDGVVKYFYISARNYRQNGFPADPPGDNQVAVRIVGEVRPLLFCSGFTLLKVIKTDRLNHGVRTTK